MIYTTARPSCVQLVITCPADLERAADVFAACDLGSRSGVVRSYQDANFYAYPGTVSIYLPLACDPEPILALAAELAAKAETTRTEQIAAARAKHKAYAVQQARAANRALLQRLRGIASWDANAMRYRRRMWMAEARAQLAHYG